MFLVSNKVENC